MNPHRGKLIHLRKNVALRSKARQAKKIVWVNPVLTWKMIEKFANLWLKVFFKVCLFSWLQYLTIVGLFGLVEPLEQKIIITEVMPRREN